MQYIYPRTNQPGQLQQLSWNFGILVYENVVGFQPTDPTFGGVAVYRQFHILFSPSEEKDTSLYLMSGNYLHCAMNSLVWCLTLLNVGRSSAGGNSRIDPSGYVEIILVCFPSTDAMFTLSIHPTMKMYLYVYTSTINKL